MKNVKYFIPILLITLLTSCSGPRSLTKKGNKFSEAGIHDTAIEYYLKALRKKRDYVKAQIALENSARAINQRESSKFFQAFTTGDNKTAVYTYIELDKFIKKISPYTKNVKIAQSYTDDFETAKKEYLEARFEEANELISNEKFTEANSIFKEIEKIDKNFSGQDFETLREIALLEPHYRKGTKYMSADKYRKAYYEFKFIVGKNSEYKDSKYKFEDALENARYTVGIMEFKNFSRERGFGELMSSSISENILKSKDPFLKLIDRTSTDKLINEQMMSMKGLTTSDVQIQAGALIGAKALLTGSVIKVEKYTNAPRGEKVKAYKKYQVKKINPETKKPYYETKYKKTTYMEYNGSNSVVISFKFQLISTETGEILESAVITEEAKSHVNYATYKGDYKDLVPGTWKHLNSASSEDKVRTSNSARRTLRNKFQANKKLTSTRDLRDNLQKKVADIASQKIIRFNPEER